MLKLVGKPRILLPITCFIWKVSFLLTVWQCYQIKVYLSFSILRLILRRILNLWPLPNGVSWCFEQKCLYPFTNWIITKAMKSNEYPLYVFSEGVWGALTFKKCTSLECSAETGSGIGRVREPGVWGPQPAYDFGRGPHHTHHLSNCVFPCAKWERKQVIEKLLSSLKDLGFSADGIRKVIFNCSFFLVFKENSKIGVQRYDNESYLFFMIETEWRLLKITNCSELKITFPPLSRSIWWISLPFDRRANGCVAFKSVGYTDKVAYFGNPALLLSDRSSLTTFSKVITRNSRLVLWTQKISLPWRALGDWR